MPPHSSQSRRHLINGPGCPERGPFIPALGDASRPVGVPHTGPIVLQGAHPSCPGCWHAATPWTVPRRNLVFFSFISSSGRRAALPEHSLNTTLIFLRPWSRPGLLGSHKPPQISPACGLWTALEAAPAAPTCPPRAVDGNGGRGPQMHLLSDPQGGTVHFTDGETEDRRGELGGSQGRVLSFSPVSPHPNSTLTTRLHIMTPKDAR